MIAAVQDANVLIDLLNAGLLEVSVRLDMTFHVVDVVVEEIAGEDQRRELDAAIENGWLTVDALGEAEAELAASFQIEAAPISFQDAASLSLAQSLKAILLTGDRPLRNLAQRHSTETHGVLWVLDILLEASVIDSETATNALQTMLDHGARLPKDDCAKRFAAWKE